ncbi:MAG: UDP-N-acetylmuramoyl-tripeptide--D-alanyl-D-alanine ligase, partial [Candidatus Omnitrophica bacterium]|nr:UDP-N-acetylmuramoyl-tripeptide--D-alanyl-D-alanine ligase [Candidatus Omnitrophota bacterium]
GRYNIYNALTAIAVARVFGISYRDIIERLSSFCFPKSRLQLIKLGDVRFIDDTYNANPVSLREALMALERFNVLGRRILILADMLELGRYEKRFHSQAGKNIARVCDVLICVGRLSKLTADSALKYGLDSKSVFVCKTTQEAKDILFNRIDPQPEDIVLAKGSRLMKMEEILR